MVHYIITVLPVIPRHCITPELSARQKQNIKILLLSEQDCGVSSIKCYTRHSEVTTLCNRLVYSIILLTRRTDPQYFSSLIIIFYSKYLIASVTGSVFKSLKRIGDISTKCRIKNKLNINENYNHICI